MIPHAADRSASNHDIYGLLVAFYSENCRLSTWKGFTKLLEVCGVFPILCMIDGGGAVRLTGNLRARMMLLNQSGLIQTTYRVILQLDNQFH